MSTSRPIAEVVHCTWAARGHLPSIKDVDEVLCLAYDSGRRAGAVEILNRLREVMKQNYYNDPRKIAYSDVLDVVLAVVANEVTNLVGEEIASV